MNNLPTIFAFLVFLCAQVSAAPPNVLLITADDLGLQLGCYGDKVIRTPHLDALARRGRLFENAYVAQASCSPSRSAMFTGLYPHANGQYGLLNAEAGFELHEPLRDQTIPALLKKAGYRTGILGKLHVGPESSFPFDVRIKVDTRDVKTSAAEAGRFLQGSAPFFLMANFSDPHVIGRSPRPPQEAFPTQYKGIPETPLRVGEVPPFPFQQIDTPEQIERVTQYYNAVMRLDAAVGLLLAELEKVGHTDDTLILFVGDHGPPFFRGKTSCYEGGVRVPMLAVWPGVFSAGERTPALVSTVDLLPTILDATAQPMLAGLHGLSLRHTLNERQHRQHLATEFHYHGASPFYPRRTIRDARFKLIHNLRAGQAKATTGIDGDASFSMSQSPPFVSTPIGKAFARAANPPEFELYDLKTDPWEFENLATSPEHAAPLAHLQSALLAWRKETNDPLLTPEGMAEIMAREVKTPPSTGKKKAKSKDK
jgi:N-sulfoglucosamine sulfohydrolase